MPMPALTHRTFSDNTSISGSNAGQGTDRASRQIKKALSKISLESIFRLNIAKQLSGGDGGNSIDARS